jgi:uncharacterized delta-60 repeat protein/uncharacterized repeat protein (TIGR01451 family)
LEDRLVPAGALDAAFDGDGRTTLDFVGDDTAGAVVVQPDGRIVVAGSNGDVGGNFIVARFNPDGSADATFDADGKQDVAFGGTDFATSVAVHNGKYVVAGYTDAGGSDQFAVLRLTAVGSLDTTFDGDGKQVVSIGAKDVATAVAVQPDGRIVVGGYTEGVLLNDFAVVRLDADGSLDTTFSGDGRAIVAFLGDEQAFGLALQPNRRIILAGSTIQGGNTDFALARVEGDTAGLSVTISDGVGSVTAGGLVTYTIVVTNAGPETASGAQLVDLFPAELLGVTYTSVAAGGATGNTAAGAGALADVLTLPAGSWVVYTVTGALAAGPSWPRATSRR